MISNYAQLLHECANYQELYIDLFAGAGGVSLGIESAYNSEGKRVAKVICCVNHDRYAIQSHAVNLPGAIHLNEDIRKVNIDVIVSLVTEIRECHPRCSIVLWASIECTEHSIAKGACQRDPDSRTLAEDLLRYIAGINPDKIYIENVKEFLCWGPLIPKVAVTLMPSGEKVEYCPLVFSKLREKHEPWLIPDPARRGEDFRKWITTVEAFGYSCEYKILNCADYGCPTIRKRLFIQFCKPGVAIGWPEPTHHREGRYLPRWIPIKECIDLNNVGRSVLTENRITSAGTFERLIDGLLTYCVVPGPGVVQFIDVQYGNGFTRSIDLPATTLTTKDRLSIVSVYFGVCDRTAFKYGENPGLSELKAVAAALGISDIKMRQLDVRELCRITTLPDGYVLLGGTTRAKKFIGNAVPPKMVSALISSNYKTTHL